jgi:hypothetical protein
MSDTIFLTILLFGLFFSNCFKVFLLDLAISSIKLFSLNNILLIYRLHSFIKDSFGNDILILPFLPVFAATE